MVNLIFTKVQTCQRPQVAVKSKLRLLEGPEQSHLILLAGLKSKGIGLYKK